MVNHRYSRRINLVHNRPFRSIKKQKNAINVITRDVDIRSRFFGSVVGVFTLKSMGITHVF